MIEPGSHPPRKARGGPSPGTARPPPCRRPAAPSDGQVSEADRQFWSFRPPARPPVPAARQTARARNPIDAFLLAALDKKGLGFSPEADRLTLLRRASFDLTGLPPTPKEV